MLITVPADAHTRVRVDRFARLELDDSPLLELALAEATRAGPREGPEGPEEHKGCAACGGELAVELVGFARCLACGAATYVPRGESTDVRVARFWVRALAKKGIPPSLRRGTREARSARAATGEPRDPRDRSAGSVPRTGTSNVRARYPAIG